MKVIVLGAGVIGTTTAYLLARAGNEVTVLEKLSSAGNGASYGNGAQLSYSHVETWASKSNIIAAVRAAFSKNSFLSISDFSNKELYQWLYEFLKNSANLKATKNSEKLFQLGLYSKAILDEILKTEKIEFDHQKSGILHFFRKENSFAGAQKKIANFYSKFDCKTEILTAEQCVKKEPSLVNLYDNKKLAGGVLMVNDEIGNSFTFTKNLEKICKEKYGVVFEYNTEVRNILTNHQKITGINTSKQVFVADEYIYTLGAYGNRLLNGIGINPKIYPLKGYSISIPVNEECVAPTTPLTDSENKVVYSRIGNIFRIAGNVELSGMNISKNHNHIKFLKSTISSTFADFGNINDAEEWFGFRPFRPNSIPLICKINKYRNLFLNTGHGSLGWTMACASAKIISDFVMSRKNKQFEFLQAEENEIYK
jgi:D-amino-acid dehydrogenase